MSDTFTQIDDTADPTFNELLGINDAGVVAGYYGSGTPASAHPNQAYTTTPLYAPTDFTSLASTVPGTQNVATGINDLGLVVGYDSTVPGSIEGFYIPAGQTTPVEVTVAGSKNVRLLGVNDLGQAVGYSVNSKGLDQAFTLDTTSGGTPQILSIPGATSAQATGINVTGVICGVATIGGAVRGFVDNNGTVTVLTGPAGATAAMAFGLNNQGEVAGEYTDAGGVQHGFVYDIASQTYATIDDPNAVAGTTMVRGINDQGQVVGFYTDSSGNTDGMLVTPTGTTEVSNPTANTTLALGPGSAGLRAGGSAAVELLDPGYGNALLAGNAGADTLVALAGADTLLTGAGNDTVMTGTAGDLVFLGPGNNVATLGGASTVVATAGNNTVNSGNGSIIFGGAAGSTLTVQLAAGQNGPDTVVAGAATVVASGGAGPGSLLFGGSGADTLVGGGGFATIVGGSQSNLLASGTGGADIFAGAGSNTIIGTAPGTVMVGSAAGASSIFATDSNQQVFLQGASPNLVDVTAASGNESLIASASSGNNVFVMGTTNTLLYEGSGANAAVFSSGTATVVGGSGPDSYVFQSGATGADTLIGFNPAHDIVDLTGVSATQLSNALQSQHVSHGSSTVVITGATIEFFGVTHVSAGYFNLG